MKHIIILGDGMADHPVERLGGKTLLQYAHTPYMDMLAKKGATYQNVYFASDGEAGRFTASIFAYPTTYVVDRSGNIAGDPIVGAVTEKNQAEALQAQINKALSADMG